MHRQLKAIQNLKPRLTEKKSEDNFFLASQKICPAFSTFISLFCFSRFSLENKNKKQVKNVEIPLININNVTAKD
jgi:hypothetical protein